MLNMLINYRLLTSPIIYIQRSITIRSTFNLDKKIKLLNDNKQFKQALQLFDKHEKKNIEILSSSTITQVLKACTQLGDLKRAENIHHLVSSRIKNDSYILVALIHLYMQCAEITRAQSLFHTSTNKILPMYGAMMKGYITNKLPHKAINLFNEIKNPDAIIINLLFNACAQIGNEESLNLVKKVSKQSSPSFLSNPYLLTSLLDAFMKCGDVEDAQSLFDKSTNKTISMYGAMMKGHRTNHMPQKAIELFNDIENPNEVILNILFNACAQIGTEESLRVVKKASKQIPPSFLSNSRLLTSLVDALMKCGDVEDSQSLFHKSTNKTIPMYGAMMKGYLTNNLPNKAVELFNEIKNPDAVIINLLFNACAQIGNEESLNLVKQVSKQIPPSFLSNLYLLTSLLDALMKCRDVEDAQSLFDKSPNKTMSMYGAMMKGYLTNNLPNKAIELFNEIKNPTEVLAVLLFNACAQIENDESLNLAKEVSKKIPQSFFANPCISISLLDVLVKCRDCSNAEILFSQMKKSSIGYATLMNGFNKENNPEKIFDLFNQMKMNGIEGNNSIYLSLIKAASQISVYSISESIIQEIPKSFLLDYRIQTALIDMWGKTGYVNKAKEIFDKIIQPDGIGYTAMVNCFGLNGMGTQAVELYYQMPSELRVERSHICVLNACSHSGLVEEARSIFRNIQTKTEKIYTTVIDCFSRASFFEEAERLIDEFERDYRPELPMYMSLLSGARNDKNFQLSEKVYTHMKKLFPESTDSLTSASILLANVYASAGDTDKASDIRNQLHKSGAKKQVGLSWTVVDGQLFRFRAHDQSHSRSTEIYAELEKISEQLIEHGHQYDSSWITRSLNQHETVASVLCGHSEKLAIAWNFVANPNTSKIQITKNLRVCGDCHRATKLIALIRQCEIIVRDANRVHHFYTNGQCSCNDYF